MANTDAPNGFTPAYHLSGGTIRMKEYRIADGYATSIFNGDMVKLVAAGVVEQAAAGDSVVGVFAGCQYTAANGEIKFSKYWPASTDVAGSYATAYVYDDPMIVFTAQFDGASGIADIGQMADIVVGTGNTSTGRSASEISSTTGTSTAQLRILDFVDSPDNDPASDNAVAYVQINEHEYNESAAATGI